jgi:DNA repair protein RadC
MYLTNIEELELLLSYAIPRKDVKPIAKALIQRFGDLQNITSQSISELETIKGIGEVSAIYLLLIGNLLRRQDMEVKELDMNKPQMNLFDVQKFDQQKPQSIKLFANDEIANSLEYLSEAYSYPDKESFEAFLVDTLPYNSGTTRKRRARYILSRFLNYPGIQNPLTYLFSATSSEEAKRNALFYVIQKQELIAYYFAEEVIWPNLAMGFVTKAQISNFVSRYFPEASEKTIYEIQKALINTYGLLDKGRVENDQLLFSLQNADLESFLFVLTSEYPQPETIPFEKIMNGFVHQHMLWHRDWIKDQLYRLRELKIISKIAEIDFLKKFTIDVDQKTALEIFYQSH